MKKFRISNITKLLIAISLTSLSFVFMIMSYSWFADPTKTVSLENTSGQILTQYFHKGQGTEGDPFVITRPIHYYNLVNLYQLVEGYSDEEYYFQVGLDDYNNDGKPDFGTDDDGNVIFKVYDYDDNGEIIINTSGNYTYSKTLNLSFYNKNNPLLPLGTHDKNFLGTFDGKGITISGFTVSGDINKVSDIGIFGYVGSTAKIKDVYFRNVTISLVNVTNSLSELSSDTQTHNSDMHTVGSSTVAYVGYIAGHIVSSTQCDNVYCNNVTITGGSEATSGFGYFGCVENEDGTAVQTLGEAIGTQFGAGTGVGWGGSLDMKSMFNRLYDIADNEATSNGEYATNETIIRDRETGAIVSRYVTETGTSLGSHSGYSISLRSYKSTLGGQYNFNIANDYDPWIYLTGQNEYQKKTVTIYETYAGDNDAYYITDSTGKNYLSLDQNIVITNAKSSETASKWMLDSSNHLYAYIGMTKYYLNRSGSSFELSTVASSSWTIATDGNGKREVYTLDGATKYYLTYDSIWKLITTITKYTISDNNGHFIGILNNNIITVNNSGEAASFEAITASSGIKFKTTDTGETKYLGFVNGTGLSLVSNEFIWTKTINQNDTNYAKYSYTTSGTTWYLGYDDGFKALINTGYNISTNINSTSYYLTASSNLSDVSNGTNDLFKSLWQMNISSSSTTISLKYNGKIYYLGADTTSNSLILSGSSTTWYKDSNSTNYYIDVNGTRFYIVYKNGWRLETSTKYNIYYNNNYLSINTNGEIVNLTSPSDNYSKWTIENLTGTGYITIVIDGTDYYLTSDNSGNISLQTNKNAISENGVVVKPAATLWKKNGVGIYTEINNYNYYLMYENGTWKATKFYVTINMSDWYMHYSSNSSGWYVDQTKDNTLDNIKWQFDENSLWMVEGNKKYYLTFVRENDAPVLSETEDNNWQINDTTLLTLDGAYQLTNLGSVWVTVRTSPLYRITVDKNNLKISNGSLANQTATSDRFCHWIIDTSNGIIGQVYDGSMHYLCANNGTLYISSTQDTYWYVSNDILKGRIYFKVADECRRYIIWEDNKWQTKEMHYTEIKDGNNYLAFNSSTKSSVLNAEGTQSSEITWWQLASQTGDTPIYQVWNKVPYYLATNSDGSLKITSTRTIWHHDSIGFYINQGEYLVYTDGTWKTSALTKYKITDNLGHYLKYSGSFSNTSESDATYWYYENNSSNPGRIWTYYNGSIKYITVSGGNIAAGSTYSQSASWSIKNGTFYANGYWLIYDSSWKVSNSINKYYIIYNNQYLYYSSGVSSTSTLSSAGKFVFSNGGENPSGTITLNDTYYIYGYRNLFSSNLSYYCDEDDDTGDRYFRSFTNDNGKLYATYSSTNFYLYFSSGLSLSKSSSTVFTYYVYGYASSVVSVGANQAATPTALLYRGGSEQASLNKAAVLNEFGNPNTNRTFFPSTGYGKYNISILTFNSLSLTYNTLVVSEEKLNQISTTTSIKTILTKGQEFEFVETKTNQNSGVSTYIPLQISLQNEDDSTSYYSDYRASNKNTGYIVSGAYQTSGGYRSDIRVSNYDTSDIYRAINGSSNSAPKYSDSYDSKLQVVTRTATSNGYVRIKDSRNASTTSYNSGLPSTQMTVSELGLTKYEKDDLELSRAGLYNMLNGTNDVFGLHFMEAKISKNHIIYADQVSILGNTYYNYELPEDSIDFRVNEQGAINFFAGTYYSSTVTSFFSLHQIFRDKNQHITDIKEIYKIYKVNGSSAYIYLYTDGTYSKNGYTLTDSNLVFNTEWITNFNQSGSKISDLIQNALYYFEIPVNRGEYALGSVDGGVGAYLLYLDIATNGGAALETRISTEGNGTQSNFKVDYRTSPDIVDSSILQFEIIAPGSTTENTFSVTLSFNSNPGVSDYSKGLYTITIVNKSSVDLSLIVFLCDDDKDTTNDFLYAYEVIYTNNTVINGRLTLDDVSIFKSCYEYTIPASGNAG